jgi:hypothetical protein
MRGLPTPRYFLKSMKRSSSLPMQISTRYLQFGQSTGIGKLLSPFRSPKLPQNIERLTRCFLPRHSLKSRDKATFQIVINEAKPWFWSVSYHEIFWPENILPIGKKIHCFSTKNTASTPFP